MFIRSYWKGIRSSSHKIYKTESFAIKFGILNLITEEPNHLARVDSVSYIDGEGRISKRSGNQGPSWKGAGG
jgi:hypothetical protein